MQPSPIRLGTALFTLVEPHQGHEVAYNRWYERDHFYAGCLNGAYNFAGRRWVATRRLKELREPVDPAIAPDTLTGSYLALYWILDGHSDDWNRWAYRELKALHAAGRMFEHREHVHTQMYDYQFPVTRDEDGVPAELALDHPFRGLIATLGEATDPGAREKALAWYRDTELPERLTGSPVALSLAFTPLPLQVEAPGVAKSRDEDLRFLWLHFCDSDPDRAWGTLDGQAEALEATGLGRVLFSSPFLPTIPGTDTYTDELW